MMLRTFVLFVAMVMVTVALVAVVIQPAAWPMLVAGGVVLVGIVFERARYGAAQPKPLGAGWRATPERFVDEASGRVMTVWFNPETGERRYVDEAADL